jgi:tRNA(Ile2) C34 agmatinyltransferase TiaS
MFKAYIPSKATLEQLLAQQNRVYSLCYRCGRVGEVTGADDKLRCGPCGVRYEESKHGS